MRLRGLVLLLVLAGCEPGQDLVSDQVIAGGDLSMQPHKLETVLPSLLPDKVDPAHLGARSGDRIGLPLLYTSWGWTSTGPECLARAIVGDGDPDVRLTNRVEWTLP